MFVSLIDWFPFLFLFLFFWTTVYWIRGGQRLQRQEVSHWPFLHREQGMETRGVLWRYHMTHHMTPTCTPICRSYVCCTLYVCFFWFWLCSRGHSDDHPVVQGSSRPLGYYRPCARCSSSIGQTIRWVVRLFSFFFFSRGSLWLFSFCGFIHSFIHIVGGSFFCFFRMELYQSFPCLSPLIHRLLFLYIYI